MEHMAQNKKVTTFYAAEDIAKYLDALPAGDKSRRINEMLRQSIATEQSRFLVALNFNQITRLLAILYDVRKQQDKDSEGAFPEDGDLEPMPDGWVSIDEVIKQVRKAVD
jgi:hypothetical protein